jgi:hypothetical protein
MYAATAGSAVFVRNLQGNDSWVPFRNGLGSGVAWNVNTIFNLNGTLFAGAGGNPFLFINEPASGLWKEVQFDEFNGSPNSMLKFTAQNGFILGASNQGVYRSPDYGATWSKTMNINAEIAQFSFDNSTPYLFISRTLRADYYSSANKGESWELFDSQMQNFAYDFAILQNKIFTGKTDGLYYRELNPTSINDEVKPESFTLLQNYPNPFNPSTTIRYKLQANSFVSLKIYDILGSEILTLVNEEKTAGEYDVEFNASSFSSGIYYYRLIAGSFIKTLKTLLLK